MSHSLLFYQEEYIQLGNVQILRDPLKGRGVTKNITNITRGEGVSQMIAITRGGRVVCEKIGHIEGAQKENKYSQDLLSMCGSKGDIFIDQC